MSTTTIKGFFKPTAAAAAKLAQLGIKNPAGYQRASDGLWDSVTVPVGVFMHTRGNPGTPGLLALNVLAEHAWERIDRGADPQDLAHIVGGHEDGGGYVSTPITPEDYSKGGYTARYYTLAYIASGKVLA